MGPGSLRRHALLILLLLLQLFALPGAAPLLSQAQESAASRATQTPLIQYTLPPDELKQAYELYRIDVSLYLIVTVYGFVVLYLMLRTRFGEKLRDLAITVSPRRFIQVVVVISLFELTMHLLQLPFSIYRHHISLQYALSVQGWASWVEDWSKGLLIGIAEFSLLAWLLYGLIRRSPRRWWFYLWLVMIPIIPLGAFIQPVVIDPLFNHFLPLSQKHPELVAQIEQMVHRAGMDIPPERIFEMDASAKTNTLNAYVTGFGSTKRVVVWDTTMRQLTPEQTLFVVGHEMGHYVLNHIWKGIALALVLLPIVLYLVYRLSIWLVARYGRQWGIDSVGDWSSVPLLVLVFSLLVFLFTPVFSAVSRYYEHQADIYALEVIHGIVPDEHVVAARAFHILGERSLDYPYVGPVARFWLWDHPTIAERVTFAQTYDPWSQGRSPEFVK